MDEKLISRLVASLPVIAVVGIGVSIAHALGMLAPFGREWMSWLTVADLVPITFLMLPFLAVGLSVGTIYRSTESEPQKAKRQEKEQKFAKTWRALFLNIIAYLFLVVPIFVAMANFGLLLKLGRFLPFVIIGHAWAVVRLPLHYTQYPRFWGVFIASNSYLVIILALTTGYLRGQDAKVTDMLTRVTTADNVVLCQRLVYVGERGVLLYDRVHNETTIIPNDQVKSLTRTKECWRKK